MADFLENFRNVFNQKGFVKEDPLLQNRWRQADFSGFEKGIESGQVPTEKAKSNEYDTITLMDALYSQLSDQFQDYFYNKYKDSEKSSEEEVPEETMRKESQDFIKSKIESGELNYPFANGKSFIENFYAYGYDDNLLPNFAPIEESKGRGKYRGTEPLQMPSGNWVTGRRINNFFPFNLENPFIRSQKQITGNSRLS